MNFLWIAIGVLLAVATLLGVVRLLMGPSILDRALSVDVLLASALTGVGAYAAFSRDPTVLPTLLVLSLLGFVGSVSIARFVARNPEEVVNPPADTGPKTTAPTDVVPKSEREETP